MKSIDESQPVKPNLSRIGQKYNQNFWEARKGAWVLKQFENWGRTKGAIGVAVGHAEGKSGV